MDRPIAVDEPIVTETTTQRQEEDILLDAARKGDSAAFEVLAMRNRRLLMAITRRMTGSLEGAEDLTQQAFMKAYANLSRFGGRCSFSTWLVSIAINEARMWNRKARRSREVSITDLCNGETFEMPPPEFMDWRPNPEVTCTQVESKRLLLAAMDRLKPGMRDALRLCDLEEQSTIAAALMLGISTNALKSRRLRGRLALRERLGSSMSSRRRPAGKQALRQAA